jgi:hypothetical protein
MTQSIFDEQKLIASLQRHQVLIKKLRNNGSACRRVQAHASRKRTRCMYRNISLKGRVLQGYMTGIGSLSMKEFRS